MRGAIPLVILILEQNLLPIHAELLTNWRLLSLRRRLLQRLRQKQPIPVEEIQVLGVGGGGGAEVDELVKLGD